MGPGTVREHCQGKWQGGGNAWPRPLVLVRRPVPFHSAKGKKTPELHSLAAQIQSPDVSSSDLSMSEVRHVLLIYRILGSSSCLISEVLGGLKSTKEPVDLFSP